MAATVLAIGGMSTRCEPMEYPHSAMYAGADPDALVRLERTFQFESEVWLGPAAASVDLDGDGDDDLVWRHYGRVHYALGPSLVEGGRVDPPADAWVLADADDDGTPDLFIAANGRVEWLGYDLDVQGWVTKSSYQVDAKVDVDLDSLVVADVDGDGLGELIGSSRTECDTFRLETGAGQSFDGVGEFVRGCSEWRRVADVDADGADDVLSDAGIVFGDADGAYEQVSTGAIDIAHDLDGDGDLDLLDFGGGWARENVDGRSFGEPYDARVAGEFQFRTDVIGDPEPEIVVLDRSLWEEARILLVARSADDDGLEVIRDLDGGMEADAVVAGDFDGDGSIDLLYSWSDRENWVSGCGG